MKLVDSVAWQLVKLVNSEAWQQLTVHKPPLQSTESLLEDTQLESLVTLSRGVVVFVPAHTVLKLHSLLAPSEDGSCPEACSLLAYAATANDNMFAPGPARCSSIDSSSDEVHVHSGAAEVGSDTEAADALPQL